MLRLGVSCKCGAKCVVSQELPDSDGDYMYSDIMINQIQRFQREHINCLPVSKPECINTGQNVVVNLPCTLEETTEKKPWWKRILRFKV